VPRFRRGTDRRSSSRSSITSTTHSRCLASALRCSVVSTRQRYHTRPAFEATSATLKGDSSVAGSAGQGRDLDFRGRRGQVVRFGRHGSRRTSFKQHALHRRYFTLTRSGGTSRSCRELQNRVLVLTADIGYHATFRGGRPCPAVIPGEPGGAATQETEECGADLTGADQFWAPKT
jgi:hypothetical protein